MKKALVCGAGGFIGGHLIKRLKSEGYWVCGADIKKHEFEDSQADEFIIGDLRGPSFCKSLIKKQIYDELYQLAADMGGAGYIFTGENDANIMHNSVLINLNILEQARISAIKKIFYSSSACIYPDHIQKETSHPGLKEHMAYPARPDSEYGWEKLFSERLYLAYAKDFGLEVHIARLHNVFGPNGTWNNGKEKAPAAICRKVAEAADSGTIKIWGDGHQTRTFLYIDECIEGIRRLMQSNFSGPVNIGSAELVSINESAKMVIKISGKSLKIKNIPGPTGVRGRRSDNTLIERHLKWKPIASFEEGLRKTYPWIAKQVASIKKA